jgi:hypothetical protein
LMKETLNVIKEVETGTFGKLKEEIHEDIYADFTKDEINDRSIDKLDEDEVASIHQSLKLEKDINLGEFIRETTLNDIDNNIYVDDRVIVFENYTDKEE